MSSDRDTQRIVRSWLEEGVTTLPDRVLDNVLAQLPQTPQRRRWWTARRSHLMSNTLKMAMATGVIALAVVLGLGVYFGAGNVAAPPDATLTVAPTTSPAAVAASPSPTSAPIELPQAGDLEPGTYLIDDLPSSPLTLTFPEGWMTIDYAIMGKPDPLTLFKVAISPWLVGNVYGDFCQWNGSLPDPPVGPTVDDLATALLEQTGGRDASGPTPVTLGGYSGVEVKLSLPDDFDLSSCDGGDTRTWATDIIIDAGGYIYGPGQQDTMYILDVDGERLVIHAMYLPSASEEDRAELQAVVDSIEIDP